MELKFQNYVKEGIPITLSKFIQHFQEPVLKGTSHTCVPEIMGNNLPMSQQAFDVFQGKNPI
jgi:hypothetical protein